MDSGIHNMDLIINPTNKCNFNCSFCSASNIENNDLTSQETINFIDKYKNNIDMIIFNGGDPLMMPVKYYEEILSYIDSIDLKNNIHISFTSNLLDFYRFPLKWKPIFTHDKVGVITSFQFGNKRKLKNNKVYTENMFIDTINEFESYIGYKPDFISVTDYTNREYVIKTVSLAKKLDIKCKINKAMMLGRETEYYPLYEYYKDLISIIDSDLYKYELNCKELLEYIKFGNRSCPLNTECYKSIRTLNPDNLEYQCDKSSMISNRYNLNNCRCDKYRLENKFVKIDCISCKYFKICNSCSSYIREVRIMKDEDNFCNNMKFVIPLLIKSLLSMKVKI